MPLHIDYRPKDFTEVFGNEDTVDSLRTILKRKDAPHSMLFTGPSGCGKTTLARLAVQNLEVKSEDLVEVDTADFRGIETVRNIRQQMHLMPLRGERRAWVLDECHQLSKDAQSALLKALEDTPEHVYFMLCTTDPQKLLPTIINRCTKFSVQALNSKRITELLYWILEEEDMEKNIPVEAITAIAKNCLGSPRAALVMLDKIVDLPKKNMLEAVDKAARQESRVIDLCRALIRKDSWKSVRKLLRGLQEEEPEQLRHAVLKYCAAILTSEDEPHAYVVMDCFRKPFYNEGGQPGLIMACYEALNE